jgi:hypothetical protein
MSTVHTSTPTREPTLSPTNDSIEWVNCCAAQVNGWEHTVCSVM